MHCWSVRILVHSPVSMRTRRRALAAFAFIAGGIGIVSTLHGVFHLDGIAALSLASLCMVLAFIWIERERYLELWRQEVQKRSRPTRRQ